MYDPFGILADMQPQQPGLVPQADPKRSPLPPLNPGEEDSTLKRLTGGALSGVGYVGGILDKTFGARALRGLAGGRPRESLSIIPGSDTFGLTDEQDRVSGEDLAKKAGLLEGEGEKGSLEWRDLVGPAIEMGLDPATYLTFGGSALSKAGQVAKRAGLMQGIKGGSARAGTTLAKLLSKASPEAVGGATRAAEALGTPLSELSGMKLGGHVGVGLPFSSPMATFDLSGPLGVAGKVGNFMWNQVPFHKQLESLGQGAKNVGAALFDKSVQGTLNPALQEGARGASEARAATEAQQKLGIATAARKLADAGMNTPESLQRIIAHNENQLANLPQELSHQLHPAELEAANTLRDYFAPMVQAERARGYATPMRGNYMPNYWDQVVKQTEGFGNKVLPGTHRSQIGREQMFENIKGGLYGRQQLTLDPQIVGAERALQGQEAVKYIKEKYLGWTPEMEAELVGLKGTKPLSKAEQAELADLFERSGPAHGGLAEPGEQARLALLQAQQTNAGRYTHLRQLSKDAKALEGWAARLDPSKIGPAGAFMADPFEAALRRGSMHARLMANSNAIYDVLGKAATEGGAPGARPLTEVLRNVGAKNMEGVLQNIVQRRPELFSGIDVMGDPKQARQVLKSLFVPEGLANDVTRMQHGFQLPDVLRPVVENVLDPLTSTTKALQTAPWPGFHLRNLVSNLFQSAQSGLNPAEIASATGKARTLLGRGVIEGAAEHPWVRGMGLNDEQATRRLADLAYAHGAVSEFSHGADVVGQGAKQPTDFLKRIPGEEPFAGVLPTLKGAVPQSLSEALPWNVPGGFGKTENFAPLRAGREIGKNIEDTNRLATFLAHGERGAIPEVAAKLTKEAHLDYSNLSNFEKSVMRRLVPFYSFSRHNIPMQVKNLAEHPGGLAAQTIRLGSDLRDQTGFVPPYLQSGLTIPIGKEDNGQQRFLTGLGLPYENAFELLKPGPAGAEKTAMAALGQLNPLIKGPLEFATGKQFYSGRDLADLYAPTGSPAMEQLLMNSPLSRLYTTGKTIADLPRKGVLGELLNLGTGAKVTDVDMEKQRTIAARELIDDALRGSPNVRRHVDFSVRPEDIAGLSPQEIALMRLGKTLDVEAQKRARMRQP